MAVYGRRRIGKTYLVHNLFKDEFAFEMSGSIDAPAEAQLSNLAMLCVNLATQSCLCLLIGQRHLRFEANAEVEVGR